MLCYVVLCCVATVTCERRKKEKPNSNKNHVDEKGRLFLHWKVREREKKDDLVWFGLFCSLSGPLYLLFWGAWSSIEINVHASDLLTYHLGKHRKPQQKLIPKGSVTFSGSLRPGHSHDLPLHSLSLVLHHHHHLLSNTKRFPQDFSLFLWCLCP